jgi:hypothetical protein
MKPVQDVFFEYAMAFEETYKDDDWERLRPYFADDAVYEVLGGPQACRIEGCDDILAGFKKSVDSLDRRMDERHINLIGEPQIEGDTIRVDWRASYKLGEAPQGTFVGRSEAIVRDGKIVSLRDIYRDEDMADYIDWQSRYAPEASGSYV